MGRSVPLDGRRLTGNRDTRREYEMSQRSSSQQGQGDAIRAATADPLLAARYAVPAGPEILVRRGRLLDRLTAGAEGPLTLVDGPAGAGKTALAAQWASDGSAPP